MDNDSSMVAEDTSSLRWAGCLPLVRRWEPHRTAFGSELQDSKVTACSRLPGGPLNPLS
jgi:hypothetical protein